MSKREERTGKDRKEAGEKHEKVPPGDEIARPLDYVGGYIEQQRNRLGFSRINLADKAGVTDKTIYNIEKGITKSPNAEVLGSILTVLREPEDSSGLRAYAAKRQEEEEARRQAGSPPSQPPQDSGLAPADESAARRQRYGVAAFISVGALLVLGVVLFLTLAPKDEETALQTPQDRSMSISLANVADMLRAGDIKSLSLATGAGLSPKQVEAALTDTAGPFFQRTKGNSAASEWFRQMLDQGLNPELRVSDDRYQEVALIYEAIRSGNAEAALALIEAGASAHGYQSLLGRRSDRPFFLFPTQWVSRSEKLSPSEKKAVIAAMFENSVAFYEPPAMSTEKTPMQTGDDTVISLRESNEQLYALTQQRRKRCSAATFHSLA